MDALNGRDFRHRREGWRLSHSLPAPHWSLARYRISWGCRRCPAQHLGRRPTGRRGNPVRIRNCPATVTGNDRRH